MNDEEAAIVDAALIGRVHRDGNHYISAPLRTYTNSDLDKGRHVSNGGHEQEKEQSGWSGKEVNFTLLHLLGQDV